jgi:hypothetical protein
VNLVVFVFWHCAITIGLIDNQHWRNGAQVMTTGMLLQQLATSNWHRSIVNIMVYNRDVWERDKILKLLFSYCPRCMLKLGCESAVRVRKANIRHRRNISYIIFDVYDDPIYTASVLSTAPTYESVIFQRLS